MKHFEILRERADVMNQARDIRERLSNALHLMNDVVGQPSRRPEQPVTEQYVRVLLALRRKRDRFFDGALFADPAWDMLLELYAAELGQRRVSVSCLCVGAAVPATTALRWIAVLEKRRLICKRADPTDGRRVFVALAPEASRTMDEFFAQVPAQALLL